MSKSETISHMRSCLESYKKYLMEILMSKSKYGTPKYEIIDHIEKLHKDSGCCLSHKECDPDNIRFITETKKMNRIVGTTLLALTPVVYSSVKKAVKQWESFIKTRVEKPVYKERSFSEVMKPHKCTDREWSCRYKTYSCLTPCPDYWMHEARNFQNPQKLMDYVINYIRENKI